MVAGQNSLLVSEGLESCVQRVNAPRFGVDINISEAILGGHLFPEDNVIVIKRKGPKAPPLIQENKPIVILIEEPVADYGFAVKMTKVSPILVGIINNLKGGFKLKNASD